MNFADCFIESIEKQTPSSESLEFLAKFMEENPMEYLTNLFSLINSEETSDKIKINAIKSITVPVGLFKRGSVRDSPEFDNLIDQIYTTLEPFLQRNDNIGKTCRESLIACFKAAYNLKLESFLGKIFQTFNENTDLPIMLSIILDIIKNTYSVLPDSSIEFFYNILQKHNDENIIKICLEILCHTEYKFNSVNNENDSLLIEIIRNFVKTNPKEISLIINKFGKRTLSEAIPDIFQLVSELFFEDKFYLPYIRVMMNFKEELYTQLDIEEIYRRILPTLLEEYDFDGFTHPVMINHDYFYPFTYEGFEILSGIENTDGIMIFKVDDPKIAEGKKIMFNHAAVAIVEAINSDTLEGFICGGNAYISLLRMDAALMNSIIPFESILEKIPFGREIKLDEILIEIQSICIGKSLCEPTEEIINNYFEMFTSENEDYRGIAAEAISNICSMKNENVLNIVWEFFTNLLGNNENTTEFNISILDVMKSVSAYLPQSFCLSISGDIISFAETIISSNENGIYISKVLGIIGNITKIIGKESIEFAQKSIDFANNLLEDYEDDCMFIFSTVIEVFGQECGDIIQRCFPFIKSKLEDIDNVARDSVVVKLTLNIVESIDDEELLFDIAQFIVEILTGLRGELAIMIPIELSSVILELFKKIPQRFSELIPKFNLPYFDHVDSNLVTIFYYTLEYCKYNKCAIHELTTSVMFVLISERISSEEKNNVLNTLLEFVEQSNLEVKPSLCKKDYDYLIKHFPNDAERVKNCFDASVRTHAFHVVAIRH